MDLASECLLSRLAGDHGGEPEKREPERHAYTGTDADATCRVEIVGCSSGHRRMVTMNRGRGKGETLVRDRRQAPSGVERTLAA